MLTTLVAIALLLAVLGAAVLVAAGRQGAFAGTAPTDLGVHDGRLKAPSNTANSVSSQAALYPGHRQARAAAIAPLRLHGDAAASMARLRVVLEAMSDVRIVQTAPDYLRAEATTRWLRFVDDLEFWVDPSAGVIQLRSASRLGQLDFGTNRRRIEAIRAAYEAAR